MLLPLPHCTGVVKQNRNLILIFTWTQFPLFIPLVPNAFQGKRWHHLFFLGGSSTFNNCLTGIIRSIWLSLNFKVAYCAKIQFKRKGSWINIRRPWPALNVLKFGHGKPMLVSSTLVQLLRYKKYLFYHAGVITATSPAILNRFMTHLWRVRPLGVYTLRGIRFARFSLYKRDGKISQYKHLKSKIF